MTARIPKVGADDMAITDFISKMMEKGGAAQKDAIFIEFTKSFNDFGKALLDKVNKDNNPGQVWSYIMMWMQTVQTLTLILHREREPTDREMVENTQKTINRIFYGFLGLLASFVLKQWTDVFNW